MRVLHVVRQFHPSVGGLEGMVLGLARQQRSVGLDAEVLTLDRVLRDPSVRLPTRDLVEGIPVRRIGCFGPARYPIAPAVLGHLRGFDLVHVHGIDFFGDFLAVTAPLHRKPLVLSTHGGIFHTTRAYAFKRLFFATITRLSLTRYRRVIACSEHDRELFGSIAGERLRLIENGVDIAKFAEAASAQFRPSLVYFGRFASHKRLDLLLDAFELAAQSMPDLRLLLIGNDWDGSLSRLLEGRGAAACAAGRVRIATGLSDEAVRGELGQCTFFVTASQYEGFGLALVEALSAGLFPIANCIPSAEAILSAAGVGRLVDFSDTREAGHAIAAFIGHCRERHPALRAKAIEASRRYGWENVEQQFRADYEAVLGTRRRAILGVELLPLRRREAVAVLDDALTLRRSLRVAFANANTLTIAARDRRLREALAGFLVLNDGIGVDIASRIKFGRRFPDNLNGTDFVPHFLDATQHALRIYLVGATAPVLRDAAAAFRLRWPRHQVVGARDGYFASEQEIRTTCAEIRQSRADLVLVGLGNPLQELWISHHGETTGAKLLIGVGALFDFISGRVPRAPPWIRRLRCEWLYRLAREPRRLASRYLTGNVTFLHRVLRDRSYGALR